MAKKRSKTKAQVSTPQSHEGLIASISNWMLRHDVLSAFLFYALIILIFFSDVVFQGKIFFVPDSQAPAALNAPLWKMFNAEGIHPFWSPYIFSGLPTYGSLIFTPFVYFPYLAFSFFAINSTLLAILHFPFAGLGVYLVLRDQKVDHLPAFLGGLAFMLTPHLISMETFGHGSKLMTSVYLPLAFWAMHRLFNGGGLKYIGIAGLILGFQFQRGHVQIVYYTWLLLGFYLLFFIVQQIKAGDAAKFYKPLMQFAVVLLLALGMAAVLYLPVFEYMPYSIRGAASVFATAASDTGVGMDYATQWSFSPGEMMTFIIPSFYGFGGQTYWGTMPFTDYPHYMSIIVLGLAIFALIKRRKEALVIFLLLEIIIALLISFGKNLSFVYGFFYDFFPYFNKFRVPVMILLLVQFGFAVLAGLGLQSLIEKMKEKTESDFAKKFLFAGIAVVALLLLLTLAQSVFQGLIQSFYPVKYDPATQAQLNQMRFDLFFKDMWLVGLIAAAALFLLYAATADKIKLGAAALVLCVLTVVDLWFVIGKINNPVSNRQMTDYLREDQVGQFVNRDKSTFRIFPVNVGFARLNLFEENRWSAQGVQSAGGYHAAKLRVYQDFLEGTGFMNNYIDKYYTVANEGGKNRLVQVQPDVRLKLLHDRLLDFLNIKYIISPYPVPESQIVERAQVGINYHGQRLPLRILENGDVLERAFFVDDFRTFEDPKALFNALNLGSLDPTRSVALYKNPGVQLEPDSTATVEVVSYHAHDIKLKAQSRKPQILVLSDPYFPVGWKAFINGEETEILQANHAFRAIVVPAGDNAIEFRLQTPAYNKGKWITLLSFLVVLGLWIWGSVKEKVSTV